MPDEPKRASEIERRTIAALDRIGEAADRVGQAAERVTEATGKIEPDVRSARRSLRTASAAAWADLLGRLFGRGVR